MSNQYDTLGFSYAATKSIPSKRIQDSTLLSVLRPSFPRISSTPLRVLDLACGNGDYSRRLLALGASSITAIDLSPGMISAARSLTPAPSSITYAIGDCARPLDPTLVPEGMFDLVLGVWLLNYACDQGEMDSMWRNVSRALKPGGRFVGVKPHWEPQECEDWYGVRRTVVERDLEGGGVKMRVELGEGKEKEVSFMNYVLPWDVYRRGAQKSGMKGLEVEEMVVPEAEDENEEFWAPLKEKPIFEVITAWKA